MKRNRNENPPLVAETREEKFLARLIQEQMETRRVLGQINLAVQFAALVLLALIALSLCNLLNIL